MSEGARDLLNRGIAAAKAQDNEEARFYLEWVLRTDGNRRQKAKAWLWLSSVAQDEAEKRQCLEEALTLEPSNHMARRGLAILDGRLNPQEIIDPNRKPAPPPESPQPVKTRRFVCQKCGGKMAFKPDGKSLRCEYCNDEQSLLAAMNAGAMVQEHDFTVALATAKGHARPEAIQPMTCQGCGASFLLAPSVLSVTCSYCGSAHVIKPSSMRQLVPPEGIIPFEVSHEDARSAYHQWFKAQGLARKVKVTPLRGIYFPAWTFDLSGEIRWQCYLYREEAPSLEASGFNITFSGSGGSRQRVREEGSHLVYEDDILVPASHKLPADLIMEEAQRFLLTDVKPYDESYIVDWPATVYEISVSDASLVARQAALTKARRFMRTRLNATLGSFKDLHLNTTGMIVESFKLILLPIWFARYRHDDAVYHVLVNGQTGKIRAQKPTSLLRRFLGSVFS